MISPAQIRAARALLGWKQSELAAAAGLSLTGLNNIETGSAAPKAATLTNIQTALEKAGIDFIPANGGGAGVRLSAAQHSKDAS